MRWVDRENHILYKIDRNNPKTLPGNDGNNVPGISYLKPRKKVFGSQAGVTSHLLGLGVQRPGVERAGFVDSKICGLVVGLS